MAITRNKIPFNTSSELLAEVDLARGPTVSRSTFIERLLRDYFRQQRDAINRRDMELINANAEYLNREAEDVLLYQAPIEFSTEEE